MILVLVCGKPGSGKSTLAKALAKEIRACLIDKDCIDEPFSPNDRGTLYQTEIEPKVYQALLNLAQSNLELGQPVILDAPWTHNLLKVDTLAADVLNLAAKTQAKLAVIEIELSQNAIRGRLQQRGLGRDANKLTEEGWLAFLKRVRFGEKNPLPHFILNGEEMPEACLSKALGYIHHITNHS